MGFIRQLTGESQARAVEAGARTQAEAGRQAIQTAREQAGRAQEFFQPFAGIGQRGVEASQFLADPQAQFQFLQQNPLFEAALENVNRQTQQQAAARGRLSAGDTLQQLGQNVLLASTPLLQQQRQDINTLLGLGTGIAGQQAAIESGLGQQVGGLQTGIGSALSAGQVGAANVRGQAIPNLLNLATGVAGLAGGFGVPGFEGFAPGGTGGQA